MYKKLAGMTGTADTEADEFHKIYKLDVVVDPDQQADACARTPTTSSTRPSARSSRAVVDEIIELPRARPAGAGRHRQRREVRGRRDASCKQEGHPAQRPERQAARARGDIVAQAGRKGAVTDRHQHGRPRHRHHPRRQPRDHGARTRSMQRRRRASAPTTRRSRPRCQGGARAVQGAVRRREEGGAGRGRPAHPRHRAPRVAPHRQPAARPRRPPGRPGLARASTCRSKTT